ncbi:MAG: hypothetical protein LRZ97_01270, partial [Candidatus Pacebacteria bacterium]|nr:hypothetical protein [Candidatus Paceibacterota bacterium]
KYTKYKKYIGTLPEITPLTKASILVGVSENPVCEEATICIGDNVVNVSNTCEQTTIETCEFGCLDGQCNDSCIPKINNYCFDGDVYEDDNSCQPQKVEECRNKECIFGQCELVDCPYNLYCVGADVYRQSVVESTCTQSFVKECSISCSDGFCTSYEDLNIESDLNATPLLVSQGGTTNVTWDIKNAISCSVLVRDLKICRS